MEIIFEALKILLPSIITGLFAFFIAKYTYHKNIPLDKLEISYNRIYYPIYQIISNENDLKKIIDKCMLYFCKYNKYIDASTIRLFNLLCECGKETKRKSIYRRFKDNIYDRKTSLTMV